MKPIFSWLMLFIPQDLRELQESRDSKAVTGSRRGSAAALGDSGTGSIKVLNLGVTHTFC